MNRIDQQDERWKAVSRAMKKFREDEVQPRLDAMHVLEPVFDRARMVEVKTDDDFYRLILEYIADEVGVNAEESLEALGKRAEKQLPIYIEAIKTLVRLSQQHSEEVAQNRMN